MADFKLLEPLVLVNGQRGVTVIPQATPLIRLNYFDGKFLRATDLKAEQDYLRQLVRTSNQAGGAGVAHGFDVTLGSGDALEIGAGLAIDPAGRVLLLPGEISLGIQTLIDRSRAQLFSKSAGKLRQADQFDDCELAAADQPANLIAAGEIYVVVIAHAEALCGEEDVFGKLCEEACATSTDRPYLVEGLVVRAVPLALQTPLPDSRAVSLTSLHLRSRVASAYFETERRRVASQISKPGLESAVWCLDSDLEGGIGVPIAVIARAGGQTVFLDPWIARRERIDAPAKRYWQWRMMMRPWDVYLAQILQFQCQLHDLFRRTTPPGDDDPCDGARDAIKEAAETIADLSRFYEAATNRFTTLPAGAFEELTITGGLGRLNRVNTKLLTVGQALAAAPPDRLLIRGGIIELPSAGYLPVVPGANPTVNLQVRRMMGEGVDLRFCIVRPDYVAHALEEAQHMERISLVEGLDDAKKKPQVDILVPDGEIVEQKRLSPGRGYDANVGVLTELLTNNDLRGLSDLVRLIQQSQKSYARFSGAARSDGLPSGGGAFYLGGVFERSFSSVVLTRGDVSFGGGGGATPPPSRATEIPTGDPAPFSDQPGFTPIRAAAAAVVSSRLLPGLWISLNCDENIFALERGDTANVNARAIVASSLGKTSTIGLDAELNGKFRITQENQRSAQGEQVVRGRFDDAVLVFQGLAFLSQRIRLIVDLEIVIRLKNNPSPSIEIALDHGQNVVNLKAAWGNQPLEVTADITAKSEQDTSTTVTPLAVARLKENADVLSASNENHQQAIAALDVVGRAIGDSTFTEAKSRLLFPPPPKPTDELIVRGTKDWVLFHRRRTKVCSDEKLAPPPPPKRRYLVWETRVVDLSDAGQLRNFLIQSGSIPLNRVNPVNFPVEFGGGGATLLTSTDEVLAAWRSASPGNQLVYGAISLQDALAQDGETLALNRLDRLMDTLAPVSPPHPQALDPDALPRINLPTDGADGVILLFTIRQTPNLTLTKADSPDPVTPGSTLTYTVNFANTGPSAASNVSVTDAVPANTTFVSASVTGGTGWTPTLPAAGGTGNVVFTKSSVASGETATFRVVVRVSPNTANGTTITNTATASAGGQTVTARATTIVNAVADLAVTKTDSPDPVIAGQNITYTINFTNLGPGAASNVRLTDTVPANTTFVSAAVTPGSGWTTITPPVGGSGNVVFSKASVAAGETATFQIVVRVGPNATGTIINTVTAAAATTDPNPGNNSASTTTNVTQQPAGADLGIIKTAPGQVAAGQPLTYTLRVTNTGPAAAQNVIVTDTLPAQTTFVNATPSTGSATHNTGVVTWTIPSLAAGATASITIIASVGPNTPGGTLLTNRATVQSATSDPNPANNTATATTTVTAGVSMGVVVLVQVDGNDHFPPQNAPRTTVQFSGDDLQGDELTRLVRSLTPNQPVAGIAVHAVKSSPDDRTSARAKAVVRAVAAAAGRPESSLRVTTGKLSDKDRTQLEQAGIKPADFDEVIFLENR